MNSNSQTEKEDKLDALKKRLDALVMIMLKSNLSDEKGNIKLKESANLLYSVGYTPTEIAKALGKKKGTEVTYLLYGKKK